MEQQQKEKGVDLRLFDAIIAIVFAAFGFVVNMAFEDIKDNRNRHNGIPHTYVSKEDYREDQAKIIAALTDLSHKIQSTSQTLQDDYNRRMDKMELNLTELIRGENHP